MAAENGNELLQVVGLLGAGVVAVSLFRRLGLGSVLGYLAAGLLVGPFGLRLISDPRAILHIAELGVVMLMFIRRVKRRRRWRPRPSRRARRPANRLVPRRVLRHQRRAR